MKSFKEFSLIIEGRSRAEAQKDLQSKSNPGDWELVNAGSSESPSWRVRLKSSREVAGSRPTPTYAGKSKESKEQKARAIAKKTQGKQESENKKEEPKQVVKNVDPKTRKGANCLGSGCKGSEHLGPPKPAPKKPVAKPAPKKPVAKKPSDEVRCLGSGCKGSEHLGPPKPAPKKPVAKPAPKKPVAKPAPKKPTPKKEIVCLGSGCPGSEHLGPPKPASKSKSSLSNYGKARSVKQVDGWGKTSYGTGSTQKVSGAVPKSNSGRPFARGAKTVYHTNKRKIW